MNKKKQEKLLNKYPKIFAQFTWSPMDTAMCWGIETGDGWIELIDSLCADIQRYVDKNPEVEQVEATQVKQKHGGLRFYYRPYNKVIDDLIWEACSKSVETCEECGSTEEVMLFKSIWNTPLCDKCTNKRMKER